MLHAATRPTAVFRQAHDEWLRAQAANNIIEELWGHGYCGLDMVGTFFRIVKFEPMDEALKLEFVKVRRADRARAAT